MIASRSFLLSASKILISSLDNYGALFPFLEDNNEKSLIAFFTKKCYYKNNEVFNKLINTRKFQVGYEAAYNIIPITIYYGGLYYEKTFNNNYKSIITDANFFLSQNQVSCLGPFRHLNAKEDFAYHREITQTY